MSDLALAFDLDGVVLDSEAIKLQSFASVFTEYPQALDQITACNAAHRGVPRADKVRFICHQLLALPDPEAAATKFLEHYAARLAAMQVQVAPMPGIAAFLERTPLPKYVCSSAPVDEVIANVARHGLTDHFVQLWGYPVSKVQALGHLRQPYATVIFFGDADANYQAAQAAGADFVAVVTPDTCARFTQLGVPMLEQFQDVADIHSLLRRFPTSAAARLE